MDGRSLVQGVNVRSATHKAALILILVLSDVGAPWWPVGEVEQ